MGSIFLFFTFLPGGRGGRGGGTSESWAAAAAKYAPAAAGGADAEEFPDDAPVVGAGANAYDALLASLRSSDDQDFTDALAAEEDSEEEEDGDEDNADGSGEEDEEGGEYVDEDGNPVPGEEGGSGSESEDENEEGVEGVGGVEGDGGDGDAWEEGDGQGLTLVHFSAQLEHLHGTGGTRRGCAARVKGVCRVCRVFFVSDTAQVELKSD